MPSFVIKGRPISVQASAASRAAWRGRVAAAAGPKCPAPVNHNNLRIKITFYYNTLPDFDTDNMSKPICDALIGIAYDDDNRLSERTARRKDINGSYRIRGINPELAVAIAEGDDFVFIEIEEIGPDEVNLP